jgi:streptogramin lyase
MSARCLKSILLIGVALELAACAAATPTPESATSTSTVTATPRPTATPTPTPTPLIDWMAWEFATSSDQYDRVFPCPACNAGVAPLSRGARVRFVDEEGIVWAAHVTEDLSLWDPRTGTVEHYAESDGLLDASVYDIVRAPDGTIWLGTYGGANIYQDGVFQEGLSHGSGLVGHTTWNLWIDSSGIVWVDTNNGYVLTAYDGKSLLHFSDDETAAIFSDHDIAVVFPRHTQFNSMAEAPDGSLWFGTNGNGLIHYDGAEWVIYDEADGLASGSVSAVTVDREGLVWMDVIDSDLTTFDGEAFTAIDPESFGYDWTIYPRVITLAPDGAIWVGGSMVVLRYAEGEWTFWEEVGGLDVDSVEELIFGEDGSVWISTAKGLARYGPVFDPAGE